MQRNTLNFIVDIVGFVLILLLPGTGIIMRYALPPGSGGAHGGSALLELSTPDSARRAQSPRTRGGFRGGMAVTRE